MKNINTSKFKYKSNKVVNKYLNGVQELSQSPDYSSYYNAQADVYNRKSKQAIVDNTIISPIANQVGTPYGKAINTVGQVGSSLIDQSSTKSNGMQDSGNAALSSGLKYGAMGASIGSAAGPIGTAIGGAVGTIGGGIYGAVNANKNNKLIRSGLRASNVYNDYIKSSGMTNYNYNTTGDINTDVNKVRGFAKHGKSKLKMKC
jgi:hypothetical protein